MLLILAGVTINLAVNNQGIFSKSKTATRAYKNAAEGEQSGLDEADKEIAKYMPKEGTEGGSGSSGSSGSGSESGGGTSGSGSITFTDSSGNTKPLTKDTPAGTKIGTTANISGKDGETGVNLDWYLFDISDDGKTAYLVSTPTNWVPDTTKEVSGAWVPRLVDEPDKEIQVSYRPNATYTISHLVSTTTFDERNKEKTKGVKLQKLSHPANKTNAMEQAIQKLPNRRDDYNQSSVTYTPSAKTLSYYKSVNSDWAKSENGISTKNFSEWNENEQAACYLADADIFAGIKEQVNNAEGNLKGKIQTLVGGASIEQWCKAYNKQTAAKDHKITCEYSTDGNANSPGYIVNDKQSTVSNGDYITGTNTIYGNNIYGAANNNSASSNPFYSCWWLASPSSYGSLRVCSVLGNYSDLGYGSSRNYLIGFSLLASVAL